MASKTRWAIVTGHSRGMGEAMAQQLLTEGHAVLGIARSASAGLELCSSSAAPLEQWQCDLTDAAAVADRLGEWLAALEPNVTESIVLINNAALLSSIAPLHTVPEAELVSALRVGLEAPVLLTRAFLAATQLWVDKQAWTGERKVLQISSGLGRSAMASQASYCAVKAGLDNFASRYMLRHA